VPKFGQTLCTLLSSCPLFVISYQGKTKQFLMLRFSRPSMLGRTNTQTPDNLIIQIAIRQSCQAGFTAVEHSNHSI
jgi:hypothetical protein